MKYGSFTLLKAFSFIVKNNQKSILQKNTDKRTFYEHKHEKRI